MARRKTIAGSFIAAILLILAVGQGSLWVWFLFTQRSHNLEMLTDKMHMAAVLLADSAAHSIPLGDAQELNHAVENVLRDEDILSVRVSDERGRVLVERDKGIKQESGLPNPFFVPWNNAIAERVADSAGREIGSVEIRFSGAKPNGVMLRLLTVPPMVQLAVFLIVIRAIYFIFQRKVGKPMGILQDRLKDITRGDLTVQVPEVGGGEIGDIAKGLKFLVERLSSTISKLNATSENVVTAIQKLDLMFRNLSDEVKKQSASIDEIITSLRSANDSQKNIGVNTVELFESSSENLSLLIDVKKTSDEVVSLSHKLFQASDDSYSTVAEMAQTSKVMAQHSQSVLSSVSDTLSDVEGITGLVHEVERSAKESSELAENVRELASERGVLAVSETIEGMGKISANVKSSADIVRGLGSRSKDVEKMLSVIREVTEQTNLLSLNAAILAQQAGEYGKGFSVVADEMRGLSDRTEASTKEIAGIIKTIQSGISEAVIAIEAGMETADEGNALAFRVAETMGSIVEAARKSANMAMAIEKATEQQAKGLGQIGSSMDNVSRMASRMSGAMDEQLAGSDYMLKRVSEVKEIAEVTKKGVERQAEKTRDISRNVESANDKVSKINRAAGTQQSVNDGIISSVESIRSVGVSTLRSVQTVSASLKTIREEMDSLIREMERFRVG